MITPSFKYMQMKNLIGLLILLISAGRLSAQNASFNFSLNPQSVSGWTNVYGDPSLGVRTATSSGITVSSMATANWAGYNGTAAYDGGGASGGNFFPAAVMANLWYQYSSYYGAYNAAVPQLEISGLSIDSVYTIKMTGSLSINVPNVFDLNPIRYTVASTSVDGYVDVNGNQNTTDGATFHNIAPDANGKVHVYVNTLSSTNLAGISGLQITSGRTSAPTPTVSISKPLNGDILPEDGTVTISATASETGGTIARVEFYANDILIGTASAAPYNLVWTNPDPGSYTLKVRAIDGTGNANSTSISVTVQSLNYFWSTTGNIATGGDTSFIGTVDTNRLAFRTNNVERMTILKDGTIGIGTKNTYGYALAVNGTAIFTKVRVKTAGTWPDYVFKKGYELPDLQRLERYIAEHKHLPGIVSEGEVAKDGFDLGDHQAALLKKVEELTLYLIDENKRLKEQNAMLQATEKKLEDLQWQIDELKKATKTKN